MINEITVRNYKSLGSGLFILPLQIQQERSLILHDHNLQAMRELCKILLRLQEYLLSSVDKDRLRLLADLGYFGVKEKVNGDAPFAIRLRFNDTYIYEFQLWGNRIGSEELYNEKEDIVGGGKHLHGAYRYYNNVFFQEGIKDIKMIKEINLPYKSILHSSLPDVKYNDEFTDSLQRLKIVADIFDDRDDYARKVSEALVAISEPYEKGKEPLYILPSVYTEERKARIESLLSVRKEWQDDKAKKAKQKQSVMCPCVLNTPLNYSERKSVLHPSAYKRITPTGIEDEAVGC